MKKLLLLVGLVVFLTPLLANADDTQEKYKACILDNLIQVDNDRASKIVKHVCWYGVVAPAVEIDIQWAKCVLENIHKASEKNFRAADLINEACRFMTYWPDDLPWVDYSKCLLKNIEKAKSDTSANNTEAACWP